MIQEIRREEKETTNFSSREKRKKTMEIYWPSFWAGIAALLLAWALANGCYSEECLAQVNNYCSDGGCF
jgi:hypothetical protein